MSLEARTRTNEAKMTVLSQTFGSSLSEFKARVENDFNNYSLTTQLQVQSCDLMKLIAGRIKTLIWSLVSIQ